MPNQPETATPVHDRLNSLLAALLDDSRIKIAFRPVISNLAKGFINQVSEAELIEGISKLRDKIIPWVLNGDETEDEDKNNK